jgi:hypothetical protein
MANYRDHDGRTRIVSAVGRTKTAAENNLREKLQQRAKASGAGDLRAMHRFSQAAEIWERKFKELVADGRRSPTSLDTYRRHLKNHVLPAMGEVRIGEANTPVVDRVVSAGAAVGAGAVRHPAAGDHPVRGSDRVLAAGRCCVEGDGDP